jgi:hypothetical protein
MLKVVREEPLLFVERFLHVRRCGRVILLELGGVNEPHYLRLAFLARRPAAALWSDAEASSAVSNGPE